MPLSLAFVFHFNQHLTEFAQTASLTCYRGLLRVLRRHPALKFNLHVSGTLTHALNWLDTEPLELIRAGIADGQFQLLGSTYAQNVAYATDDWDNAWQIELHREALQQAFGVRPLGFWLPERCWRQSLVPLIVEAGYRYTLVEDHILHASGAVQPHVFTTQHDGRELTLLYDDEILKHKVNYAAWFGRPGPALDYLRRINARRRSRTFCLAYAEDAEAMGLWGWHTGVIPHQTWANLEALLSQLESLRWLKLIHISDAPPAARELTPVADGSAAWMDHSLRTPGAPYHEAGYADWFEFLRKSPKISRFKKLHAAMRRRLKGLDTAAAGSLASASTADAVRPKPGDNLKPPARRLYQLALRSFCAYQYEFGCIGVGGAGYPGWEGMRAGFVLVRAVELATRPRRGVWVEDVNGDGRDEILFCDGKQFAVVSPGGARLLYWFDLAEGIQWLGNQLAVGAALPKADQWLPTISPQPAHWLPSTFEPDLTEFSSFRSVEVRPTRMGRFLPDWVWTGERSKVRLYTREMQLDGTGALPLASGRGALADFISVDGGPEQTTGFGDFRLEGETAIIPRFPERETVIVKKFNLADGVLTVDYRIENRSLERRLIRHRLMNELCPDYAEVIAGGRPSLEYTQADGVGLGVVNTRTRRAVQIEASRPWTHVQRAECLLALELAPVFEFDLAPQTGQSFTVRLVPRSIRPPVNP